jgi:hypothetical protein
VKCAQRRLCPKARIDAASTIDMRHNWSLTDTDARIANIIVEGYRQMGGVQRLQRMTQLSLAIQQLALADIGNRYPQATPREQQLRLASRRLSRDMMIRAFGWDPDIEGR